MDADAAGGQWDGDPAGSDAELERPTVADKPGEEVDHRIDDRRLEHRVQALIVDGRGKIGGGAFGARHAPILGRRFARPRARSGATPS